MICILHGYLLDGSGSNLWTRSIVGSLCRQGEVVHLVCQEYHPEEFDFIAEAYRYHTDGTVETIFEREVAYKGRCVMHKPQLGDTLPVYVWDRYEEFTNVVPMIALPDEAIEDYLNRNTRAVMRVTGAYSITAIHANHAILMSVVAERVSAATSIPFAIMPHGSDIEYAVKKDDRFLRFAVRAFTKAKRIFVIGKEMRERVNKVLYEVEGVDRKMTRLNLGVDTDQFKPVSIESRREEVRKMLGLLADAPRGKSASLSRSMLEKLYGEIGEEELKAVIAVTSGYMAKLPDKDIEAKLESVDWERDKIILFVGRLIASKGLQSILAALPLILERHPSSRLIVVGHGPLREAFEAMLWALEQGEQALVERIAGWGSGLERSEPKEFAQVRRFYDELANLEKLRAYFEQAQTRIRSDRVIFTGYLTHRELRHLFPCCDVAIFPSVVAEAGPLVFLEALASGCFPLGTYFAGMAASIDSVAEALPPEDAELMKLSADESRTVASIVEKTSAALTLGGKHKAALREVAEQRYDWNNVAKKFISELRLLKSE